MSIKNLVKLDNPQGAATATIAADQIWVYENGDWSKYFYYVSRGQGNIWCPATSPKTEVSDSVVLKPGQSFFFVRSGNAAGVATLAGQVVDMKSVKSYNVAKGSTTAMAYPWPVSLKIKDFRFVNNPQGAATATIAADQIWVYQNGDWAKYFYYVSRGQGNIWCPVATPKTEVADNVVLNPGDAFFFVRSGNADGIINFAMPAAE